MRRVDEWIASVLDAEGVRTVFSYLSEDNLKLMMAFEDAGMTVVQARHEQAATGMADGYARASGRLGVCTVGQGPGIAQTGTSLVTMRKKRSPVLVLVTQPTHPLKHFRQTEYLQSTIEQVITATTAEGLLGTDFPRALEYAWKGPVALQIPLPVLMSETDVQPHVAHPVQEAAPSADLPSEQLQQMAALLIGVDRPPVIVAGRGAVKAGVRAQLISLAERTGCLLATTLQAKGLFFGHPRSLGVIGTLGTEVATDVLTRSQCVVGVGCSLNTFTTYGGGLFKSAKVVQIDRSPEALGAFLPIEVGIVGDACEVLKELDGLLDSLDFQAGLLPSSRRLYIEEAERRIVAQAAEPADGLDGHRAPLDPRLVIRKLDSVLPPDRVLISDAGHFSRWVGEGMTVRDPSDFLWTADFASIGQGLAIAAGATVHRRERPCVCVVGDAGFSMVIHELSTLVRYRIPLTVVVWNDSVLGSEYQMLVRDGERTSIAATWNPEFADVARAFGGRGLTVRSLADLDQIPGLIQSGDGLPLVVDVKIDPGVRHKDFA